MILDSDTHSAPQHAPVSAQHQRHPSSAGFLSPIAPITTLDTWSDATGNMRLSPIPLSPISMGLFVNKAKAMLRGKRNSYQAPSTVDLASGKPDVYRTHTSQQSIPRPPPRRQVTAPLLSRQSTKSGPSRPSLKKSGGPIQISQPVLITSTMALGNNLTSRESWRPRSVCMPSDPPAPTFGKYSAPPSPSKSDAQDARIKHPTLPRPQSCTSISGYTQPSSDTLRAIHEAGMLACSQSDKFPRSRTASTVVSRDGSDLGARLKAEVSATFRGYDSAGSFDARSHSEYESPLASRKPSADCTNSLGLRGVGFGVSETMMVLSDAGMLYDSEECGLEANSTGDFNDALGRMFSGHSNEPNSEAGSAFGSSMSGLACLGPDADICMAGSTKDEATHDHPDGSHDIVDEYLDFGEDTLLFSIRAQEKEGLTYTESSSPMPLQVALDTPPSTHRPMAMAQCLEYMDPTKPETLLTPWHSHLDSLSEFRLTHLEARRRVVVVAGEVIMSAQSTCIETFVPYLPTPSATEPLRIDKSSPAQSRSRTPVGASTPPEIPLRSSRRPSPSPVLQALPLSPSIPAELWEPYSEPPTPNTLTHSVGSYALASPNHSAVASTSRTPTAPVRGAAVTTTARKRRNTREMFIESQVSHVVKGARGMTSLGTGIHRRKQSHTRAGDKGKQLAKLEVLTVNKENSSEWVVVGDLSSYPSGALPKSSTRRALYASTSKTKQPAVRAVSSPQRTGMKKSPSARGGMVKSPSVRSGLSKSGSRQGLRASQSRSTLHASQSRNGPLGRSHGSPPRGSRLPTSSSTRSLPGNANSGTPGSPQRPLRSRARPRAERRRPGIWDMGQKENVPAAGEGDEDWVSGVDTPIRSGSATPHKANFERSEVTSPTTRQQLNASQSPRKRSQDGADPTRATAKALVSEIINGNLAARRLAMPSLPPKNPARVAAGLNAHNRI